MNRQFVGVVVAGALALLLAVPVLAASESKALDPGAMAPDFTATASLAGKDFNFSLKQALAKGPVVVYFYPAAYTGGCDLEAHTFATEADAFAKAGATIIGVSADSVARLNQFSADPKYCAGKFAVASDPAGKIAATYGLAMMPPQQGVTDVHGKPVTHGFLPRTTFVLDHAGKVVARLSSKDDHLSPDQHVHRSLEIVEKLQAGKAP
ncbi:MAG: peroxiredoxin [Xanthomonadales bacterium]|nr:peroxiredoxin [Xanthomonadales bacterium]ODU94680.1 MAG: AhpC/TSA family antioxidant protein [Rhodanobacter sp. SCN 66-43]OJY85261.1 MAG: peroxiredoxin [Xanthomonadales bacterium 66-474]